MSPRWIVMARRGAWISVPAAEPRDDPGGPGEAARRMRVALQLCPALIRASERVEEADFVLIEGDACRLSAMAVTRLHKLQGDDGRFSGDRSELQQTIGCLDPTVLDLEPLGLEDPEELLDRPALLAPIDGLPGRRGIVNLMGRQQTASARALHRQAGQARRPRSRSARLSWANPACPGLSVFATSPVQSGAPV